MIWHDVITDPPKEHIEVLVYTDEGKFKVCRLCRGKWDTYLRVKYWADLPEPPVVEKKSKKNKRVGE